MLFSNCWGVAAKSKNQAAAVDLVKAMTTADQQMAFAKAFGVMPSTTEGAEKFAQEYPDDAPSSPAASTARARSTSPASTP